MNRPNVLLLMCDDLGYRDTGFNGNRVIKTPQLDHLSGAGAVFTRFYAGGPVCSPTRGTCLTGRHYSRYGINHANVGHLPMHEITLPRIAKSLGYATGHFGKWHLGSMERSHSAKPGRKPGLNYAPPWDHHYDVSFATEFAVPTWDPSVGFDVRSGRRLSKPWESPYYDNGVRVTEPLRGCDSELIVSRAISFVEEAVAGGTPFFSTVWFHAPHAPVEAGPEYLAMYDEYPEDYAHYYGAVTAMDRQVGRLMAKLEELHVQEDTLVFFCSDNGPEGTGRYHDDPPSYRRSRGTTGGLRGRKRSLYSGGIAVPAFAVWPNHIRAGSRFEFPASTLDYLQTLAQVWSYEMPDDRPIDGESLIPLLDRVSRGEPAKRTRPIPYRFVERKSSMFDSPTFAALDERFKLLLNLDATVALDGEPELYDLLADPQEVDNVAQFYPREVARLRGFLVDFIESCRASHLGEDYDAVDWRPTEPFLGPEVGWRDE